MASVTLLDWLGTSILDERTRKLVAWLDRVVMTPLSIPDLGEHALVWLALARSLCLQKPRVAVNPMTFGTPWGNSTSFLYPPVEFARQLALEVSIHHARPVCAQSRGD
jgi:hypothetical protein